MRALIFLSLCLFLLPTGVYAQDFQPASLGRMPTVEGRTLSEAHDALKPFDLSVRVLRIASEEEMGLVVVQEPAPRKTLRPGDRIVLKVSNGPPQRDKPRNSETPSSQTDDETITWWLFGLAQLLVILMLAKAFGIWNEKRTLEKSSKETSELRGKHG